MEHKPTESALKVNAGVAQPPVVDANAAMRFKKIKRKEPTVAEYVERIAKGDRTALSQAITLIESKLPKHQLVARQIVEQCLPLAGHSKRIGITGVPGVGKSTFIESLGKHITSKGHRLAVLAIDPSSERSKGSILGDKTRMELLSTDPKAFIRPSPSAGSLGGVANKTRESIILCEAAGFDVIFVETVGVGQSETAVHSMVDFFLLLMLAGAGDELQGIKRGIMEMADTIAITKADGNNMAKAEGAKAEYKNALHLFPPQPSGWIPQVLTCSSLYSRNIDGLWATINEFFSEVGHRGFIESKRKQQSKYWMHNTIEDALRQQFYGNDQMKNQIKQMEAKVLDGQTSSFTAAQELLKMYTKE